MTPIINKLLSFLFIMLTFRNIIYTIILFMYEIGRVFLEIPKPITIINLVICATLSGLYTQIDVHQIENATQAATFLILSIGVYSIFTKMKRIARMTYIEDYTNKKK